MSCCILEKRIATTYIPGSAAVPATSGYPARAAYCATTAYNVCQWIPNPVIEWRWECYTPPGRFAPVCAWSPYVSGIPTTVGGWGVQPSIYTCQTAYYTDCYPAVAAIPGTPGAPAVPSQILISYNYGWNSWSRAIDPLAVGYQLLYTVAAGVYGVFVGLDSAGKEGQSIGWFPMGVMADVTGLQVFLYGIPVYTLATSYTSLTEIYIKHNASGTVTFEVGVNEYTTPISIIGDVYPYAYEYAGGDRLVCAAYSALQAGQAATCGMTGNGALNLAAPSVDGTYLIAITLSGDGSLAAGAAYSQQAPLSGSGTLLASISGMYGSATLGALQSIGGDFSFILGSAYLPALTVSASATAVYSPPQPTIAFGNLPIMSSSGFMQSVEIDNGDADFPAMQSIAGEGDFIVVMSYFGPLGSYATEGERLSMSIMEGLVGYDQNDQLPVLFLVVMSSGVLQSVQTVSHIKSLAMLSALTTQSIHTELGTYLNTQLSGLRVVSLQTQSLAGQAGLDSLSRVWVVNMESAASTQYDNYGFNSFFVRDGLSYGVADDGIYRLSGDKDLLAEISAQVNLGSNRLGVSQDKALPAVYVNAASDGKMILKVEVDGSSPYYYEARSSSTELDNHRVDTGRGLKGNNWTFTLMNQYGDDFTLANLEFVPLQQSRRI